MFAESVTTITWLVRSSKLMFVVAEMSAAPRPALVSAWPSTGVGGGTPGGIGTAGWLLPV